MHRVSMPLIYVFALLLTAGWIAPPQLQAGGMKLGNICRLKGQEINTLHGLGLVVGLRGTGDSDVAPTARALAQFMRLLGGPMAVDQVGQLNLDEVADAKNVALVFVTATIPPVGAQQGDPLDVSVSAINAKSLEGGHLMLTPLVGPRSDNPTVYAMAEGPLSVSADGSATTAVIQGGAKMESSVRASFIKDGRLTLILDRDFADFNTVDLVERGINEFAEFTLGGTGDSSQRQIARATDSLTIDVAVPPQYLDNPVNFVSLLLGIPVPLSRHPNRVVINEKDGIVVIGEDVEFAPMLISYRGLRIDATEPGLVPINADANATSNAKLKSLADALNALDVPTEDLIAIIKTLKTKGDLYGEVVFR